MPFPDQSLRNQAFAAEMQDRDPALGRLVKIAVWAHMLNQALEEGIRVFYWREKNKEVDFVLQEGRRIAALEVKSGIVPKGHPGAGAVPQALAGCRDLGRRRGRIVRGGFFVG